MNDPAVHYLLLTHHQNSAAIALITVYAVLFLLVATSYLRTVATVITFPGYIPLGPKQAPDKQGLDGAADDYEEADAPAHLQTTGPVPVPLPEEEDHALGRAVSAASLTTALRNGPPPPPPAFVPSAAVAAAAARLRPRPQADALPTNLGHFLAKEAFVCESDGLPRYCPYCNVWKPDRSHHCSEVGRCVMRMDHFCPWVGGVVAESSFRYFYQVVVYGTVYCLFVLGTVAACMRGRHVRGEGIEARWVAVLAL